MPAPRSQAGEAVLHVALVLTNLLGRLSPWLLMPVWVGLAILASRSWKGLSHLAAITSLAFTLCDGISLALLPRARRSFGPVSPPLLALAVFRTGVTLIAGLLWPNGTGLAMACALHLAITLISLYATWIEPFRLGVTEARLCSSKLNGGTPLRLLHITDLHVERITQRERELLRLVETLAPDATVLTGDYLNLSFLHDAEAQADTCRLLDGICRLSRGPVFAVTGSPPVDVPDVVPVLTCVYVASSSETEMT